MVPEDFQAANLRDVHEASREMVAEDGGDERVAANLHIPRSDTAPRTARLGSIKMGRVVGLLVLIAALAAGGAYWYLEIYSAKDDSGSGAQAGPPEISPFLAGDYRSASERAIERVRPTPESNVTQPMVARSQPKIDLAKLAGRFDSGAAGAASNPNFNLLAPEIAPALPDNVMPTVSDDGTGKEIGIKLPGDRVEQRQALSPDAYPESGLDSIEYWSMLHNQLLLKNRPGEVEGSQIDLEKAWILLSLYYNPHLDIDQYRGYFSTLTRELYSRLVVIDDDGQTRLLGSERERVKTVIDFLLQGGNGYLGWDVQEFHPGIRGMGTPPQEQNYLVDQVFANGLHKRNAASNTALNLLALVLLRKMAFDIDGDGQRIGLNLPVYGMRLPDRTILRYDARGANAILLAGMGGEDNEVRSPMDYESGTKLEMDSKGYTRNIELLRNGNHYDAEDYQRRYQISENDGKKGVYLRTLSDRRMFASIGYELAQADIAMARTVTSTDNARAEFLYDRASRMLTQWVLDRDDGGSGSDVRKSRYASDHPQPRGDLLLRDAQILLAELHLQRADYNAILAMIENDHSLSTDTQRAQILQGMLHNIRGALNAARANFEDVLKIDELNPLANLYLGEFDFLAADASLPAIYQWRPVSKNASTETVSMMARNYDIDLLASAVRYYNAAEANDMGRLNGSQRFNLHYHRALAAEQRGHYAAGLADMQAAFDANPTKKLDPGFSTVMTRLRYSRIFEVLGSQEDDVDGQLKYDAVAFLDRNLRLERDQEVQVQRAVDSLDQIGNLAVQWELVKVFKRITKDERTRQAASLSGDERAQLLEGFGRDGDGWRRWLHDYFNRNP